MRSVWVAVSFLAVVLWSCGALAGNVAADSASWDRSFVMIDTDNDGVPDSEFFPFGWYCGMGDLRDADILAKLQSTGPNTVLTGLYLGDLELDVDYLAAHGLRCIVWPYRYHTYAWPYSLRDYYRYDCEGDSLYLDVGSFSSDFRDSVLPYYAGMDSAHYLIGWYLEDEPDGKRWDCDEDHQYEYRYSADTVKFFYDSLKAADPYRDVYNVMMGDAALKDYAQCTDVLMNDEYEFRNCCGHDRYWLAGLNARACGDTVSTKSKPFVSVLQTHGPCYAYCRETSLVPRFIEDCSLCPSYYVKDPPRLLDYDPTVYITYWPEYEDLRHMTYSAILEGARGIFYWSYFCACCLDPDTSLYSMVGALAEEVIEGDPARNLPSVFEILRDWSPDTLVWSDYDGVDHCLCDSFPGAPGQSSSNGMDDLNYLAVRDPSDASRYLLIAVNDCCDSLTGVEFHFPVGVESAKYVAGAYRRQYTAESDLKIESGTKVITDDFAGWEVKVYEIFTLDERELVVYSDFMGPAFEWGIGDSLWRNHAKVVIDGSTYTTPVYLSIPQDSVVIIHAPEFSSCRRDSFKHLVDDVLIGHGSWSHWDQGVSGQFTVEPALSGQDTFVVYYDITSACVGQGSSYMTSGIDYAMDSWVDSGDTLLVADGTYIVCSLEIDKPMTLISAAGYSSTVLISDGCDEVISCQDVSGVTVGSEGHGFWMKPIVLDVPIFHYLVLENCQYIGVAGNKFDYVHNEPDRVDGAIEISRCRDVNICGNNFKYGWLYAISAFRDTALVFDSNEFRYDSETQRIGYARIQLDLCKNVGIYGNTLVNNEPLVFPVVDLDECSGDLVIGGSLDYGNEFPNAAVKVSPTTGSRIDGECNYWGSLDYDVLKDRLNSWSGGRLDFVPWADSPPSQMYWPFDPDSITVTAPDSSLCPAGDLHKLEVSVTFKDQDGDPVDSMWTDDLGIAWIPDHSENVSACEGYELTLEDKTDAGGVAVASLANGGGCDSSRVITTIDLIDFADTARLFTNSPDLDNSGDVDMIDFSMFASLYLTTDSCADFDFSGLVDMPDFSIFASHYFDSCPVGMGGEGATLAQVESARPLLASDAGSSEPQGIPARFGLLLVGSIATDLQALEAEIGFDGSTAEPFGWDGEGLHLVRIEGENQVRVVSGVGAHPAEGDRLAGILTFAVTREPEELRPTLTRLRGLTTSWEIVDLIGRLVPLTAGDGGKITYAMEPVLDLTGNPSEGGITVHFGAPVNEGRRLRLDVYDVRGRLMGTGFEGLNDGVVHTVEVGAHGTPALDSPGVYFVQLSIDGKRTLRQKVVLLK